MVGYKTFKRISTSFYSTKIDNGYKWYDLSSLVLYNIGVTDLMALTYWIANLLLQVYDLEMFYCGFKHTQNLKQFVVSLDCVC